MKLDEKTNISLFTAFGILPVAFGFIVWLTNIDSKASQALRENADSKPIIQKTYESVIRIEEKLKKAGK